MSSPCQLQLPSGAGLQLHVHTEDDVHISRQIREQGVWEAFESALLLKFLRPADVFLDIGANIGYFTVLAAQQVGPTGHVYAFEPEPRNFDLLQRNITLNGFADRCFAVEAALAASDGDAMLYLAGDNLGDHQLYPSAGRPGLGVRQLAGAHFLAAHCERVHLVKIDTQGTELAVVQGLWPLLLASRAHLRLIVELTPFSLRAAGGSGAELVRLLSDLGLPLVIIDHLEHRLVSTTTAELVQWCDNVDACTGDEGFMNILVGPMA